MTTTQTRYFPEEFAARIRTEIPKWGRIIHDANIATQ